MIPDLLTPEFLVATVVFILLHTLLGLVVHTGRWEPFSRLFS